MCMPDLRRPPVPAPRGPFASTRCRRYFRLPQLTVTNAAGVPQLVTCTGKTRNTFTGCANVAGAALPGGVSTVSATLDGVVVSTPSGGARRGAAHDHRRRRCDATLFARDVLGPQRERGGRQRPQQERAGELRGLHHRRRTSSPGATCRAARRAGDDAVVARQRDALGRIADERGEHDRRLHQDRDAGTTTAEWRDVTMEILNWGFAGPDLNAPQNNIGRVCDDPTPNAILRLQRLQDNPETPTAPNPAATRICRGPATSCRTCLFDAREAIYRDAVPADRSAAPRRRDALHRARRGEPFAWFQKAGAYDGGSGQSGVDRPETAASPSTSPIAATTGRHRTRRRASTGSRTS